MNGRQVPKIRWALQNGRLLSSRFRQQQRIVDVLKVTRARKLLGAWESANDRLLVCGLPGLIFDI